jgi:Flp pilus assembly pilin Flp
MTRFVTAVKNFFHTHEEGATAVEYAIMPDLAG